MTINVQFAGRGADARIEQQPIAPGTARLLAAIDDLASARRHGRSRRARSRQRCRWWDFCTPATLIPMLGR